MEVIPVRREDFSYLWGPEWQEELERRRDEIVAELKRLKKERKKYMDDLKKKAEDLKEKAQKKKGDEIKWVEMEIESELSELEERKAGEVEYTILLGAEAVKAGTATKEEAQRWVARVQERYEMEKKRIGEKGESRKRGWENWAKGIKDRIDMWLKDAEYMAAHGVRPRGVRVRVNKKWWEITPPSIPPELRWYPPPYIWSYFPEYAPPPLIPPGAPVPPAPGPGVYSPLIPPAPPPRLPELVPRLPPPPRMPQYVPPYYSTIPIPRYPEFHKKIKPWAKLPSPLTLPPPPNPKVAFRDAGHYRQIQAIMRLEHFYPLRPKPFVILSWLDGDSLWAIPLDKLWHAEDFPGDPPERPETVQLRKEEITGYINSWVQALRRRGEAPRDIVDKEKYKHWWIWLEKVEISRVNTPEIHKFMPPGYWAKVWEPYAYEAWQHQVRNYPPGSLIFVHRTGPGLWVGHLEKYEVMGLIWDKEGWNINMRTIWEGWGKPMCVFRTKIKWVDRIFSDLCRRYKEMGGYS